MDEEIAATLVALNHEFYACFAHAFSSSRSVSDPALTCILPLIPPAATVLDVGCGSGRLAVLLERERPGSVYVGLDALPPLIAIARRELSQLRHIAWDLLIADVSRAGWSNAVQGRRFDVVVALAVIHHIPGRSRRVQVLQEMAGVLHQGTDAPRGCVVLSNWQFLSSRRLRRKIVPWETVGLRQDQVDAGDFLLDWRRGGTGLRYCHLVDEDEVLVLAGEAGLQVTRTFRAGGKEGDLSLFSVLAPRIGPAPEQPVRAA